MCMLSAELQIRREVKFRARGKVSKGQLFIGNLRRVGGKGKRACWACSWALSKTDPEPRDIFGEDALAALVNCLKFLNGYIQDSAQAGVEIFWMERGDNAGLKWAFAETFERNEAAAG